MLDKLLTPDEVAQALGVSRRTAYGIMHQMPHLEHPFRVSEGGLRAWISQHTVEPAEPKPARRQKRPHYPPLAGIDYHIPRRRDAEERA